MVGPKMSELMLKARQEVELWHHIRMMAANDTVLKGMFENILMYYYLKYDNQNKRD